MKIWLVNHYAVPPQYYPLPRPSVFAKKLIAKGHEVTIIAASTVHNSDENLITDGARVKKETVDGVPYVYIRCGGYRGNGAARVKNILEFAAKLPSVCDTLEKPDAVVATSFDPISCFQGIRYAKKHGARAIAEIADLWPETLVAYGAAGPHNPIVLLLRRLEKKIYTSADAIVFTMEGAWRYICEQGWEREIPREKVFFINNGVELELFEEHCAAYPADDAELADPTTFKIVYTGSVGQSNRLALLIDAAGLLDDEKIRILIWGAGDQLESLRERVKSRAIRNVSFKGRVEKKKIPAILRSSDALFLDPFDESVSRYGISSNKLFEYFASGKPILMCRITGHNPAERFGCGITYESTPEGIAEAIREARALSEEQRETMHRGALAAAQAYSYDALAEKLNGIVEGKL